MNKKEKNSFLIIFKSRSDFANDPTFDLNEEYQKALNLLDSNQFDEAEKEFVKILHNEKKHLDSYLNLSKIYINRKDFKSSIYVLEKYLEVKPNSFKAKILICNSYIRNKDFETPIGLLNQLKNKQTDKKKLKKVKSTIAKVYFYQGLEAKEKKDFKNAISFFEEAFSYDSNEGKKLYNISLCYKEVKKYSKATELLLSAAGISKNSNFKNITNIYYHLGDIEHKRGNKSREINFYKEFLEFDLSEKDKSYFEGKVYFLENNYLEAIKFFKKSIDNKIFLIESQETLAKTYFLKGDYDSASSIFKIILEKDIDNKKVLFDLTMTLVKLKKWEQAYQYFNILDETDYKQKLGFEKYFGKTLLEMGYLKESIEKLEKAKKIDSSDPEIIIFISHYHLKSNNQKMAIEILKKETENKIDNFIFFKEIGEIYKNSQNYDKAIETYKSSLSNNKNNLSLKYIANVFKLKEDFLKAIHFYKKYLDLNERDSEANYNIGLCYFELVNMKLAIKYFNRLINHKKYSSKAIENLANIYISKNDLENALIMLNKLIGFKNTKAYTYIKLGKIHSFSKNIAKARELFTKAIKLDPENKEASQLLSSLVFDL